MPGGGITSDLTMTLSADLDVGFSHFIAYVHIKIGLFVTDFFKFQILTCGIGNGNIRTRLDRYFHSFNEY